MGLMPYAPIIAIAPSLHIPLPGPEIHNGASCCCCFCFVSSAPGLSPIWPSPPERRVSWLRGIVQDTGDYPFQR
ncbi:hypothetical protein DPMN_147330 [Dreissena polymorpha]|uniref:Uncharacterized protein n=1 Tax=Dreissena polymorpha TaxID=45954 RepID=A0A9D4F862_DREPO|nr:hypothetical protein DPMN_147330 [Dreissena polymorpha]